MVKVQFFVEKSKFLKSQNFWKVKISKSSQKKSKVEKLLKVQIFKKSKFPIKKFNWQKNAISQTVGYLFIEWNRRKFGITMSPPLSYNDLVFLLNDLVTQ